MDKRGSPVDDKFIEKLGLLFEGEGLPRIAGRLMGLLILSEGPCQAADLSEKLRVSHGSISTNTRLLERLGVIERVILPGDRAASYQLTDDPYGSLLSGQLERTRRIHAVVAETRRALPITRREERKRLGGMERFYRMAVRATEDLLARWDSESSAT